MLRAGVKLTGYGSHTGAGWRTSLNTVEKIATSSGCTSASFAHFELDGTLVANACYQPIGSTQRCVYLHVPEPM